jgi:hypothetical protein
MNFAYLIAKRKNVNIIVHMTMLSTYTIFKGIVQLEGKPDNKSI